MICLNRRYFLCLVLILCAVGLSSAQSAAQTSVPLVLQGGTLIDATGRPPIEDAVIVVQGERIKAVGKRGDVAIPRNARVIDVKGKTILSGLIDGHCHLLDFVGGADYAISAAFLKSRREDAKRFMSGICEGIAIARKDKAKALEFVSKSGRNLDAAGIEYLYRLYITEVIPPRPHLKIEGIELATQMSASLLPSARAIRAEELIDATVVPELEKQGRCNF
jgi:hypothetical protein